MPYDTPAAMMADAAASLHPAAVVSADSLISQGLARIIERAAVASHVDVSDSLWRLDRAARYSLLALHVPALDADTLSDITYARALRSAPVVAVVVLQEQGASSAELLAAGADIVLTGRETPEALRAALAGVAAGFSTVAACLARDSSAPLLVSESHPLTSPFSDDLARLSPQQRAIAALITQGRSNKEIGARLSIREGTVKVHITAIFRALAVRSRTELACRLLRPAAQPAG